MANPLILDGEALSKKIYEDLIARVSAIVARTARTPALATILVGDNPASVTYVKMKGRRCRNVGMDSRKIELPGAAATADVIAAIEACNRDPDVHGILLQHPVPKQVDERACFNAIDFRKDVDGVTYLSYARTAMNEMLLGCATPLGIMNLLDHYNIPLEGREAVVVGRSPILGKPMAAMLLNRNATVTVCHSKTRDLPEVVRRADIVVGAVGKPKFIKGDWIKEGAVVVDAGYNPGNVGDVDLEAAAPRSSAYTPVPGGVGPMCIATLIAQTVQAAEAALRV
ncbi:MAG: bifunctional methylenetetrahydrofolate dehydrogenase/methenyltetrahydrofolate cyclohydrolase [Spirochaetales bacterium]|nr:bifunctional methylenetetrahydrofolate dehydrogenase/methenyltetrahydrofolate cyclohydrolase [Spirochaetales bacterium]